jgi:hypothetical protein
MALQFRRTRVSFDSTQGLRQQEPGVVNFSSAVRTAECAVNGFRARYTSNDRPLLELEIDITPITTPSISGTQVTFNVNLVLRDSSGTYDDPYKGWVDVLVIADIQ